jgi:hypothetical protein
MQHPIFLATIALLLAACGGNDPVTNPPAEPGKAAMQPPPAVPGHGAATDLGTLTVASRQFGIVRLGELVPGQEVAFEVHAVGAAAAGLATLNVYLWVESEDGTQLSAPAKGLPEGDALHFHLTPRKGDKVPHRAVLRLRTGDVDERASLPLDGHGHEHVEGPHEGVPATFQGGGTKGWLELKLHDDKGDLELWLGQDDRFSQPFDLPLASTVEVEFVDGGGRKVTLRPRNSERNEDENGVPNVRDGSTNYFIYPSQDGEDAGWLCGKEFQSIVIVRFTRGGEAFTSAEFVLKPHTH